MMDRHTRDPVLVHRFDLNKEPVLSPDSSKKRKLQHEHASFPISKYKFRDRWGSDSESSSEGSIHSDDNVLSETIEWRGNKRIDDYELEKLADSAEGSTSYSLGRSTAMTLDSGNQTESLLHEVPQYSENQPSTSSDSCNNTTSRHSLYSLDRRNAKMLGTTLVKDDILLEHESTNLFLGFEVYNNDHITSESESNEFEHYAAEKDEGLMLYSDGITSDAPILSYGKRDDKQSATKPTIDKEFEQYFSMLML